MGEKPQVKLRALEPEDLNFLYEIENDEMIWNVGLTNVPYSKNLLLDYIASSSGDIFSDKQVRMIIVNERGEDVGMVDLIDFSPGSPTCRVGIGHQKFVPKTRLCVGYSRQNQGICQKHRASSSNLCDCTSK